MDIYFENLLVELHVFNIFKTHFKFHINQMLFTIKSINFFLCIILYCKFKYLIDDIIIDL